MFVIEVPFCDIDQMYNSGQVFRWIKFRDGKYVIPYQDKVLKVEQVKNRLIMSCSEQEFYDVWYHYFDLETDYSDINYRVKRHDQEILKIVAVRGKGIHILKQDLFEMIVTFMLATATNIPNIKRMLDQIVIRCGVVHRQSMRELQRVTWGEFPTPEQILVNQDELDDSFGLNRKENVIQICQDIVDGWLDLEELESMSYADAKEYLMKFDGIGPKVADCICLYGLHHLEAFPIDTHIAQVLKREFDCDEPEVFADWFLEGMSGYEGVLQQYLFYHEMNPPKERVIIDDGFGRKHKKRGPRKSNKNPVV